MGFSLKGLLGTAAGIAPYALSEMRQQDAINAQKQAAQDAQDETLRSNFFKGQANDRANDLNAAQVANLTDDGWSKPIAATGPNGEPILVQQDRRGNFRPAEIGAGSGPTRPSIPGVQATTSTPTPIGLPGGPSLASSIPKQAPAVPVPATTTTPLAGTSSLAGQIRPYVKPSDAEPKIDPDSPEGIAAAKQKAVNAATARAQNAPPRAAPRIDPLSSQGIAADSVKTANHAALKPPAAAAGGSASLSPEDRNRMMSQAKLDNQVMKDYEAKVLSGQASVGTTAGVAGALSEAHDGTVGKVTGILANRATGAIDPDYQRYITAQRSYGRIMGNLQSKRYTDNQAEIERSISGLQGNDLPGTIRYKQQMRDASLADVAAPAPTGGGRGGGPAGNISLGASPLRAKYDAAAAHLKAQGKTDAQVQAAIGSPPEEE